jgi:hypothetical protein
MVAGCGADSRLLHKVADVYQWLDAQISENEKLSGRCSACGQCCDFLAFGHHLFVTTPELMYFAAKIGPGNIRTLRGTHCPYLVGGKCSVYNYRFAGCRIFCCSGDEDFQSDLSESAVKIFRTICEGFRITYCYRDFPSALKSLASV